jgi:hypothetical protein
VLDFLLVDLAGGLALVTDLLVWVVVFFDELALDDVVFDDFLLVFVG